MSRLIRDVIYNGQPLELFPKSDMMQEVVLSSLDDLWVLSTTDVTYSFRGQSDSSWPLKTSFERFVSNKTCRIAETNIEQQILRRYRSECSIFSHQLGYDPHSQDTLGALADIQHYGGPTRLLDWTSSLYAGLFFAVFRNDTTDAAVYCLRNIVLNAATVDIRDFLKGQPMAPGVEDSLPEALDRNRLLHMYSPKRRNERIMNQEGHFIYPGSIEVNFEQALSYSLDDMPISFVRRTRLSSDELKEVVLRSALIKLIVPKEMLRDVQKHLLRNGFSARKMFPDYHGAILSLYETSVDTIGG